jgi:hypothetical protein
MASTQITSTIGNLAVCVEIVIQTPFSQVVCSDESINGHVESIYGTIRFFSILFATKKIWRKGVDLREPVWYNGRMDINDPDSFVYRLQHTIAHLEAETQAGIEDWTPTIVRLREVLAEELSLVSA